MCDNLAVWGSAQFVAVRAVVCGSARGSVRQYVARSVLAAVCGSAHGVVRAVICDINIPRILLISNRSVRVIITN
jgi:hypothetical protein